MRKTNKYALNNKQSQNIKHWWNLGKQFLQRTPKTNNLQTELQNLVDTVIEITNDEWKSWLTSTENECVPHYINQALKEKIFIIDICSAENGNGENLLRTDIIRIFVPKYIIQKERRRNLIC